ncbi:hypothetical protein BYT27DRAFT_6641779 [Phlegmacium glaucopus]|nr:hypothetical protein BYT27DRAFT_6641779 [Phlegmacium glaucopus]
MDWKVYGLAGNLEEAQGLEDLHEFSKHVILANPRPYGHTMSSHIFGVAFYFFDKLLTGTECEHRTLGCVLIFFYLPPPPQPQHNSPFLSFLRLPGSPFICRMSPRSNRNVYYPFSVTRHNLSSIYYATWTLPPSQPFPFHRSEALVSVGIPGFLPQVRSNYINLGNFGTKVAN